MENLEREARERKKRMIALGSLPLCMGFFVWRLQSTTAAAPPPKAPPPSVVAKAAPVVAAAAGPVLSLERDRIPDVPLGGKDPFIAAVSGVKLASAGPAMMPGTGPKPVSITEMGPTVMPLPPANPMLHTFGAPPPVTPPSAAVTPIPGVPTTPVAPPMPYVLSGIVKGNPDVAVLRHYDGSHRIARVGEALDRKFRLTNIEETTVIIAGDGENKTLRLGEETPAPPAKK